MTKKKPEAYKKFPPVPVTIAGTVYPSMAAAARAYGVALNTIKKRALSGTLDDMVLTPKMHEGSRQAVTIRGVTYPSQSAAAKALGVSKSLISHAKERGTLNAVGLTMTLTRRNRK